jgi:Zn-dependent protease
MLLAGALGGLSILILNRLPLGTGPQRMMLWYSITTLLVGLVFNRVLSPARRWHVSRTLGVAIVSGVVIGFFYWYLHNIAG